MLAVGGQGEGLKAKGQKLRAANGGNAQFVAAAGDGSGRAAQARGQFEVGFLPED